MTRSTLSIPLLLSLSSISPAQTPEITRITPFSATVGESVHIVIEGKNLGNPRSIWTDFESSFEWVSPDASQKPDPNRLQAKLKPIRFPEDPTGFFHITTATGFSNPLLFLVDDLPILRKNAPGKRENALAVTIPQAIAGHTDTAEPEFFRVSLETGNPISIEVHASRIGSRLDPRLRILDPDGQPCLTIDDSPGLAGDCRVRFIPKRSGDHFIELRDVAFNGGSDFRYHLRVGNFPLVEAVYPPLATAGTRCTFHALHPHAAGSVPPITIDLPKDPSRDVRLPFRFAPEGPSAPAAVRLTNDLVLAEALEPPPNTPIAATESCTVVGRLTSPVEQDRIQIHLSKDDRIVIDPINREIGSAANLHLSIHRSNGELLAVNDSAAANLDSEIPLTFKSPKEDDYIIHVEDAAHRGHPNLVYALRLLKNPAPFEIAVASDRFVAPKGGAFTAKVTAQRKGMNGPISILVESGDGEPLPEGVHIENAVIEKGKNETTLKIILPDAIPEGTIRHLLFRADASENGQSFSTLASLKAEGKKGNQKKNDSLSLALNAMPQPPRRLTEGFPLCVGPEAPDFFRIELTDRGALLTRTLGKGQFVLRQTAIDKSFDGNAMVRFENLPEGITISHSGARGGRIAGQVDFVCEIKGPVMPMDKPMSFDIVASADFKGASKEIRLKSVPLKLVDPLEINASLPDGPAAPGSQVPLQIIITRHDPSNNAPAEIAIAGLPEGVSIPLPLKALAANESAITVPLTIAPSTPDGQHNAITVTATTRSDGAPKTVTSETLRLQVKR